MTMIIAIFSFLVNILVDGYVFILVARTALLWRHAERINPLMQLITKLTNPVVKPCKKWLPDYHGIEIASISLIISMTISKLLILCLLNLTAPKSMIGLLLATVMQISIIIINLFCYALFMQMLALLKNNPYREICALLDNVTLPILNMLRRWLPSINGIDISAIVALLLIQLMMIVAIKPLLHLGLKLTFGDN